MTGDTENITTNRGPRIEVSSIGNAWVICNSKTRPGFKYYFNTLTGESVWNLSPTEVEKAKRFTKALPIAEIEKCPEPTHPPMEPSQNASSSYNKPIINTPFSNQIPNMFPVNMNMLNALAGGSNVNPNIWANLANNGAIPPGQVVFVAIPNPMNVQQQQGYMQHSQGFFPNMSTDSMHESEKYSRHSNIMHQNNLNRGINAHRDKRQNDRNRNYLLRNSQQHKNWNNRNLDLRQKLNMRKRSKSLSSESRNCNEGFFQNIDASANEEPVISLEDKTPSKYDLSPLKHLKAPHSKAENWFIVVDADIILENFPFLNKITDPDQSCYLLVPDHVMTCIKLSASNGQPQVRRIYRFLSEQIECELAFRGAVIDDATTDTEKMLTTCSHLASQNNVVLLSNNEQLHRSKNKFNDIHVLTLNEIKSILQDESTKRISYGKTSPTLAIKIVVPNDVKMESLYDENPMIPTTPLRSKTPDTEITNFLSNKNTSVQSELPVIPSTSKQTVDTGVQTNKKLIDEVDASLKTPEKIGSEKSSEDPVGLHFKRTLQNNLNKNDTDKAEAKKYRWRKLRRNSNIRSNLTQSSNELAGTSEVVKQIETVVESQMTEPTVNEARNENDPSQIDLRTFSPLRAPSIDRSSTSTQCKKVPRPNVIIEETSTSGVISNTNDSESTISLSKDMKNIKIRNFELFEIAGPSMEEVLRTRRDEWVLRFAQIMEEILREKLRDNSPCSSKDYAEPWATDLPELTRCIIKKYSDYFNVVDAANRLSFTLYRISDNKGGLSANIPMEPSQYMDMYSYGVYLIGALMDVNEGCEDLKAAEKSLKKLLYDIQNTHLENNHNDIFPDDLNESINVTEPFVPEEDTLQNFPECNSIKRKDDRNEKSSTNSYMLRSSNKKKTAQIHDEPQPNDEAFFSSLQLKKTLREIPCSKNVVKTLDFQDSIDDTPKSKATLKEPSLKEPQSPKILKSPSIFQAPALPQFSKMPQSPINSQSIEIPQSPKIFHSPKTPQSPIQPKSPPEKQVAQKQIVVKGNTKGNQDSNDKEPLIVRNFNSIAQFEEKLLKRQYEDSYDDYYDYEYYDDNYDDQYYEEDDIGNADAAMESKDEQSGTQDRGKNENITEEDDNQFRRFILYFVGEMKELFGNVKNLCADFVQELKTSKEPKPEMRDKLKETSDTLLNLANSLNSILDRECRKPDKNITILLQEANLKDFVPNEELRLKYTDIVNKYREQALKCHTTVTVIMKEAGIQYL